LSHGINFLRLFGALLSNGKQPHNCKAKKVTRVAQNSDLAGYRFEATQNRNTLTFPLLSLQRKLLSQHLFNDVTPVPNTPKKKPALIELVVDKTPICSTAE
jgi:hypothetical protein